MQQDLAMPPPTLQDLALAGADLSRGGVDLGGHVCNSPWPGECCDAANKPAGSASCDDHGGWVCAPGTSLCRCGDDLETFRCTDFCGSDEFSDPVCMNGKWECPGFVPVRTDSCAAGTCWGLPIECCDKDGHPMGIGCEDGQWTCGGTWCYLLDGGVH
jgi:hypothetical protein